MHLPIGLIAMLLRKRKPKDRAAGGGESGSGAKTNAIRQRNAKTSTGRETMTSGPCGGRQPQRQVAGRRQIAHAERARTSGNVRVPSERADRSR